MSNLYRLSVRLIANCNRQEIASRIRLGEIFYEQALMAVRGSDMAVRGIAMAVSGSAVIACGNAL